MIIVMKDNYIQSQFMATLERFLLLPEIRIASVHKKNIQPTLLPANQHESAKTGCF